MKIYVCMCSCVYIYIYIYIYIHSFRFHSKWTICIMVKLGWSFIFCRMLCIDNVSWLQNFLSSILQAPCNSQDFEENTKRYFPCSLQQFALREALSALNAMFKLGCWVQYAIAIPSVLKDTMEIDLQKNSWLRRLTVVTISKRIAYKCPLLSSNPNT